MQWVTCVETKLVVLTVLVCFGVFSLLYGFWVWLWFGGLLVGFGGCMCLVFVYDLEVCLVLMVCFVFMVLG